MKFLMSCSQFFAFFHELVDWDSLDLDVVFVVFHGYHSLVAQPNVFDGVDDATGSQISLLGCFAEVRFRRLDS